MTVAPKSPGWVASHSIGDATHLKRLDRGPDWHSETSVPSARTTNERCVIDQLAPFGTGCAGSGR